jgi:hypothetical protein
MFTQQLQYQECYTHVKQNSALQAKNKFLETQNKGCGGWPES